MASLLPFLAVALAAAGQRISFDGGTTAFETAPQDAPPVGRVAEIARRAGPPGSGAGLSPLPVVEAFEESQARLSRGDVGFCDHLEGRYRLARGGRTESVRFTRVARSLLPFMGANRYESILRYDRIDGAGRARFRGLLVRAAGQWYLTTLDEGVTRPYPSMWDETGTLASFEDFLIRRLSPKDAVVERLDFNRERTRGVSAAGTVLEDDSLSAVTERLAANGGKLGAFRLVDIQDLRIPPKMYDLLEDPDFIRARENRIYSRMYDLIYLKALEVTGGDVKKALFLSLLTVDLRERGPCGALYGLRGKMLVPPSPFDFDEPEKDRRIGSRRDAAQHFFGYALLARELPPATLETYSYYSKTAGVRKTVGRLFRQFHGDDPNTGEDPNGAYQGFVTSWYGGDLSLRPRADVLADRHYNRLGIAFGRWLELNQRALPSQTINDPAFDEFEGKFGARR